MARYDQTLKVEAGIAPYDDGSGHKMEVTIEQEKPDAEPTISIESVFQMPASNWPEAVSTIERLLKAFHWIP